MEVALSPMDWRILRQVLRGRKPTPGTQLRLDMSRRTKDGTFLTDLVRLGLLQVAEPGGTPFAATYTLTDLGRHAAEYGTYEVDWEEYKTRLRDPAPAPAAEPGTDRRRRRRPQKV